jgi:hypothetical protein
MAPAAFLRREEAGHLRQPAAVPPPGRDRLGPPALPPPGPERSGPPTRPQPWASLRPPAYFRARIEHSQSLAAPFPGDRRLSCPRKRASRSAGAQTTKSSCLLTLDSQAISLSGADQPFQALAAPFPGDRSAASSRAGLGPPPGRQGRPRLRARRSGPRRFRARIEPFQALAAPFPGERKSPHLSCPRKRASSKRRPAQRFWIPAFAGMTDPGRVVSERGLSLFKRLAGPFAGERKARRLSCPRMRASSRAGAQTKATSRPATLDPRFREDDRPPAKLFAGVNQAISTAIPERSSRSASGSCALASAKARRRASGGERRVAGKYP